MPGSEAAKCPDGTKSPAAGSTNAMDCLVQSTYYGVPGEDALLCPAGSYCPLDAKSSGPQMPTSCPANFFCPQGSITAQQCPAGKTSAAGQASCK